MDAMDAGFHWIDAGRNTGLHWAVSLCGPAMFLPGEDGAGDDDCERGGNVISGTPDHSRGVVRNGIVDEQHDERGCWRVPHRCN